MDTYNVQFANNIIAAACMLHNFIIDHGEIPDYDEANNENNPAINNGYEENEGEDGLHAVEAIQKRLAIAANL